MSEYRKYIRINLEFIVLVSLIRLHFNFRFYFKSFLLLHSWMFLALLTEAILQYSAHSWCWSKGFFMQLFKAYHLCVAQKIAGMGYICFRQHWKTDRIKL
jgi:hypothetical protein